jgi:hypothetical protein
MYSDIEVSGDLSMNNIRLPVRAIGDGLGGPKHNSNFYPVDGEIWLQMDVEASS